MQNIKKEDIDVKKYYGEDTVLKVLNKLDNR